MTTATAPAGARGIAEILQAARGRLDRVTPEQAYEQVRAGAVLVDIRPAAQRQAEGEIPGAIVIERNVLEWRLDPRSDHRLPIASYELRVIVVCSEGYTSSLAAASLLDLGIAGATDLDGGFRAWEAAGLPVS
jgi:rhodanese-related sulfurtransferase